VALFFASQGCRKVVEETPVQLAELAAIHYLTGTLDSPMVAGWWQLPLRFQLGYKGTALWYK